MPFNSTYKMSLTKAVTIRPDDIIIAFIGPAGSGKTHLINMLANQQEHESGLSSSKRSDLHPVRVNHEVYGDRIVLLDTPGFESGRQGDISSLQVELKIKSWLSKGCGDVTLAGIVYLQQITNQYAPSNRVEAMYRDLCGGGPMSRIILVTTMWHEIKRGAGERHYAELASSWSSLTHSESPVYRFQDGPKYTPDRAVLLQKAWALILPLIKKRDGHTAPLLQQELTDLRKKLCRTNQGRKTLSMLEENIKTSLQIQNKLSQLESDYHEAERQETSARLLSKLSDVFKTPGLRGGLQNLKNNHAQIMVDYLHSLLLMPSLPTPWFQKQSLVALYKLSKSSLLFPRCYILKDIVFDSRDTGGAFSDIYKGRYGAQHLCLKVVRLHQRHDTEIMLKIYAKEAILWEQLRHPNIAPFYGIYYLSEARDQVCLVSPWMDNRNLVDYLKKNPSVSRTPFISDIVSGLGYLHNQDLVHSDIKGVNILVNDSGRACITDFGLTFVRPDQTFNYATATATARGCSYRWAAPELLEEDPCPTWSSDIWALGCVFYEVLTGLLPFNGSNDFQIAGKLIRGEVPGKPTPESGLGSVENVIWKLINRCWARGGIGRPKCQEILQELERLGLTREQGECPEDIALKRQNFQDAMKRSEEIPIDLDQVERILNEL